MRARQAWSESSKEPAATVSLLLVEIGGGNPLSTANAVSAMDRAMASRMMYCIDENMAMPFGKDNDEAARNGPLVRPVTGAAGILVFRDALPLNGGN